MGLNCVRPYDLLDTPGFLSPGVKNTSTCTTKDLFGNLFRLGLLSTKQGDLEKRSQLKTGWRQPPVESFASFYACRLHKINFHEKFINVKISEWTYVKIKCRNPKISCCQSFGQGASFWMSDRNLLSWFIIEFLLYCVSLVFDTHSRIYRFRVAEIMGHVLDERKRAKTWSIFIFIHAVREMRAPIHAKTGIFHKLIILYWCSALWKFDVAFGAI